MKLFFLLAALLLSISASSGELYAELGVDRESEIAAALHKSWQMVSIPDCSASPTTRSLVA